jgi:hypothetical protein
MNKSLEQAPEMLEAARVHGGVSMDPDLGDLGGQPGFAVGGMIAPEGKGTTSLANLPLEEFRRYIRNNARAMGKKNQFPGLWQDDETGKAAMDITTRLFDPAQATREGILAGQKAIFDLGKYAERPVMGLPARTRTAILKGGPESLETFGSPTRFGGMLGLDPGDLRGLAQGGDQDAISALLRLAQSEEGSLGRNIKMTRSKSPGALRLDAARQHLANELPAAVERAAAGAPTLVPKPKGIRPPTTAMGLAAPGLMFNAAEQSGFVDEETKNSDWYKALQALSAAGMVGGLGMAARGGRSLLGMGPKAKSQLDVFETQMAAHPTLEGPKMDSLAGTMRRGYFQGEGGAVRDFKLREGAIPDFKQNTNWQLDKVLKVSPRKGAFLAPAVEKRMDKILAYVDSQGVSPETIDWMSPRWRGLFNSDHEASVFAKLVGSLSPQKELLPNMRDAFSVAMQNRMGIPITEMAAPFGRKGTGFGFGFGYDTEGALLKNLRKSLDNEPIGSVYPNKVNELAEGPMGNVDANPWDMHAARAKGLDSDITGSPLEYALYKMADSDYYKSRGFKGAFPGMSKLWTGEKRAVATAEPGLIEYLDRINKKAPEMLRGYTPKRERDLFEALATIQEAMGGHLSNDQLKTLRSLAQGNLF